jgi:hypothetical protein
MANFPPYVRGDNTIQEIYQQEVNQALIQNLSDNGFIIPALTNDQLTVDNVIAPDGTVTTLASLMPDGTIWYITDASPPCYVGKISGSLVKFTTTSYP